ncbi:MAG TPA: hypothetical protein VLK27_13115 [Chthoniobacterales bacterium]|nr:hypothetical protein [Chthoniobacterales bacterium]
MMLLKDCLILVIVSALSFVSFVDTSVLPSDNYARIRQPACESTISNFLRAVGALIGDPWLNGSGSGLV